jgi:phosphoribosylformylglycinamidine (FGAM) synthase PurS component
MKYLKNFKRFENVEVEITDEPDVKLAKEETNNLEKSLKDFPAVKAELDKAFMNLKSDKDNELLNKKIEEINKKFLNNPFIEEYTRMMNLQMKIKYVQDELMKYNDDLYKNEEDLKQLSSQKVDTSAKLKTVNDIKSNQKIKTQEIVDLKKALLTATTEQKKKMEEIKKEMQDSSKKITSF